MGQPSEAYSMLASELPGHQGFCWLSIADSQVFSALSLADCAGHFIASFFFTLNLQSSTLTPGLSSDPNMQYLDHECCLDQKLDQSLINVYKRLSRITQSFGGNFFLKVLYYNYFMFWLSQDIKVSQCVSVCLSVFLFLSQVCLIYP